MKCKTRHSKSHSSTKSHAVLFFANQFWNIKLHTQSIASWFFLLLAVSNYSISNERAVPACERVCISLCVGWICWPDSPKMEIGKQKKKKEKKPIHEDGFPIGVVQSIKTCLVELEPKEVLAFGFAMDANPNRFILSKLPTNKCIRFHDYKRNVSMNGICFWFTPSIYFSFGGSNMKAPFIRWQRPPKRAH